MPQKKKEDDRHAIPSDVYLWPALFLLRNSFTGWPTDSFLGILTEILLMLALINISAFSGPTLLFSGDRPCVQP